MPRKEFPVKELLESNFSSSTEAINEVLRLEAESKTNVFNKKLEAKRKLREQSSN